MRIDVTRFRRASIVNLMRTWRGLKGTARHAIKGKVDAELPKEDMEYLHRRMIECVEGKGGEVSARARSAELGHIYMHLNKKGRERFLKMLGRDFNLENERVISHLERFKNARSEQERLSAELGLREALNSPRLQILRQFNTLSDGFKFLVDMRTDLLALNKNDIYLQRLEKDIKFLLRSFFDIGLLNLSEISWNSPAALLEKLIRYEAVHEISSWADLKNRLDSDRRCFAFFHNKMPDEPLIFIEVALVKGMADNVQVLLDQRSPAQDPEEADTAIFYSINNTQRGLTGISFGNFLIKWVVAELSATLKNLKVFATLSPVPGFRKWLDPLLQKGDTSLFSQPDIQAINRLRPGENAGHGLLEILNRDWPKDEKTCGIIKQPLMGFAAHYLVHEKKGQNAIDPVAHFHLSNGACLERINWLADTSEKGIRESATVMVNYLYKLTHIDDYHEAYTDDGKISISKQVKDLLK
ncbi:Malonyl-CoA decarboxylase [uncultured Desulfobacterium sp.]|uniref:Malonyl-CoA decarboxylase n=1 Tax=uncultured Desulfobacterium sp. TaxID=201089 RepID=A0A445MQM6_9BACT|nr:Malonyl-CoA decarboxylase [uncultured Desulfobacterium sp.]